MLKNHGLIDARTGSQNQASQNGPDRNPDRPCEAKKTGPTAAPKGRRRVPPRYAIASLRTNPPGSAPVATPSR